MAGAGDSLCQTREIRQDVGQRGSQVPGEAQSCRLD